MTRTVLLFIPAFVFLAPVTLWSQGSIEDFKRRSSYDQRTRNRVFRDQVKPNWIDADRFWYRVRTDEQSYEYVLVDAVAKERVLAFDHQSLAEALKNATGRACSASDLPIKSLTFHASLKSCEFGFDNRSWRYELPDGPLAEVTEEQAVENASDILQPHSTIQRSGSESQHRTPIRFQNELSQPLDYYWVTNDRELIYYGSVEPNRTSELSTYEGHAWLLRTKSKQPVGAFVARRGVATAIINQSTPAPRGFRTTRRRSSSSSPDGRFRVEFDAHNVVLGDRENDTKEVVTDNGSESDFYGGRVWWSPNSKHFVVMRTVPGQRRTINIIESSPKDSIHAKLVSIPYAKPGDRLDKPTLVLFDAESKDFREIESSLFPNPYRISDLSWDDEGRAFTFLYNQRGHQRLSLIRVVAKTGEPAIVIDESSETFICYSDKTFLRRLDESDEIIWMSERSGWNHLYLLDAQTGEVKNPITKGEWVVRGVERVDTVERKIWLQISGYHDGQDPYHVHLARVDFDGGNFVCLTKGDGNHQWEYSPNNRYLIDQFSRVDLPPQHVLRFADTGEEVCRLESADAKKLLETGWQYPERFVAKGRDGQTDIYGMIVRPTNFDPTTKYPVLEAIYAGPHSAFVPKSFGRHRGLYQMAELGFIVVKIDGMGTNHRGKKFHDVCWKNLGDSGFPDRILWMKAAAKTRREMDLARVGIWGGSAGGQSALRALLAHGDFYHAAVADCGCHDNRVDKIWWNEQWMGWPIGDHYEKQSNVTCAHQLQGDLMLIVGELDRNVDPASTMQVVNALVKADKDFEFVIMPGVGHGAAGHPYAARRQADFFIRKLWGREPRVE